jgi:hypothetical protein
MADSRAEAVGLAEHAESMKAGGELKQSHRGGEVAADICSCSAMGPSASAGT